MNLIDAIKSGRPFKRPGYSWLVRCGKAFVPDLVPQADPIRVTLLDVVSEDWEIKETEVLITASKLYSSIGEVLKETEQWGIRTKSDWLPSSEFVRRLSAKLGLEK